MMRQIALAAALAPVGVIGCTLHATAKASAGAAVPADASTTPGRPSEVLPKSEEAPKNEVAMTPGMKITATTRTGTITITAEDDLTRSYTWEGATRSVEMARRPTRWYGSLGLYFPGPGEHWEEHNGITRGVVEEGQQHFKTVEEALNWIRSQAWQPYVYRDDGLMVGWSKELARKQLSVDVWQIYVDGKKPQQLPGSQNDMIVVTGTKPASVLTSLVEAVSKNDLAAVKTMLGKGADPNARNGAGSPVLIVAAKQGSASVVEALLANGADVNAKGLEGTAALIVATAYRHIEIVKLLLANGADVNASYDRGLCEGSTALMMAAAGGDTAAASALLGAGANVNAQDSTGSTAIHQAASSGHKDLIEMLLKRGADVDSRDWLGTTPLMGAAMSGQVEAARLLIAKGANVNARDDNARRMYQRAAFTGDTQAQEHLEKSGKLKDRREDGASVLSYAKVGGSKAIIELVEQAGAKE